MAAHHETAQKSDMQKDMDGWVDKLNHAAKDHRQITHAPGDASWSGSFFDCFSPIDSCFITCCCPCVTFGKTHHRLTHGTIDNWSPINFSCIAWYGSALVGFHWVGNLLQRHDIRQRSNPKLGGEIVTDCLKAWCCNCCDLMQQDKEAEALLARERTVTHQPDLKTDGMDYAPPAHSANYGQPQQAGNYGQPQQTGNYGQPQQTGNYGQPQQTGNYGQPAHAGNYAPQPH